MRAAQINEYGDKDVLKIAADAPKPEAGPGQVLVAVKAAAVNPFDIKVRSGHARQMAELTLPATLGGDFAGVVADVGAGVTTVKVGDEVYGQTNALGGRGSFAEFTAVKADQLAPKPKQADFVTAAALPLAGVSACQALIEHLELQSGQKILIHGAAGGIASFAVQLAKHLGAYVATTAAAEDAAYVKSLGADEVIDYKTQAFEVSLQDYDAVYDTVGGETYSTSFQVLKRGGVIVSMLEQPNAELMSKYGVNAIAQFTRVTTERLNKLAQLIDTGAIKPHIGKTFPLDEAAEALSYLESGRHHGKVVITIQ